MILDLLKFNSTANSDGTLLIFEDIIDQARAETQDKIILIIFNNSLIKIRSAIQIIKKSKIKKKTKKRY